MLRYADGTVIMVGDAVVAADNYQSRWTECLDGDVGIVVDLEQEETNDLNVEVRTRKNGHIWMLASDLIPVRDEPDYHFDETEFLSMIE